MTISPKKDFLASPDAKTIADAVSKPEFRRAINAALLQYQVDQMRPLMSESDKEKADSASWRVAGAVAFAMMLLNIADAPTKSSPKIQQNLTT